MLVADMPTQLYLVGYYRHLFNFNQPDVNSSDDFFTPGMPQNYLSRDKFFCCVGSFQCKQVRTQGM